MLSPQADPGRRCRLGVCARNIVISMAPVGSGFLRITLFGKKHKEDAAASSVGLSCPKYGSSGAVFFVASVMDVVLCRPMLRCFLAVKTSPCTRGGSHTRSTWKTSAWGHPRTYGADAPGESAIFFYFGSSPYIWGKRSACCSIRDLFRFIPVCTGQMWGGLFFCVNE